MKNVVNEMWRYWETYPINTIQKELNPINCPGNNEDQLQLTATAILERYKWLKVGKLMLFFFNFKAGFYERFYNYFDRQAIIRSMKLFLQERNLAIDAYLRDMRQKASS